MYPDSFVTSHHFQALQELERVDRAFVAVDKEQIGACTIVVDRESPAASEEIREPARVVVVIFEALDVVLEGVDAGGGQQADLTHPPAEALAESVAPVESGSRTISFTVYEIFWVRFLK